MRSRIQKAVNNYIGDTYWIHATYSDKIIVQDYETNSYYEIPYFIQGDEILLGEPVETTEFFSTEQIINQMKQGKDFILLNNKLENPVYRVLVQTNNELPAHDKGLDKIRYTAEAQKNAVGDLLGEFVYDDSQSNHQRLQNPKQDPKKFAKVVNTGYCPDYGAYTDWEVFDHEYIEIMNQLLDSKEKNLPVREGPSTEVIPLKAEKYDTNSVEVTELKYNGLSWVKNPRDRDSGICQIVNNINLEDIPMSEEEKIEVNKEDYENLKQEKEAAETKATDLEKKLEEATKKPQNEEGDEVDPEVAELKQQLEEANTELANVKNLVKPLESQYADEKVQVVNSLLSVVPEADKEKMKTFYEDKDLPELKILNEQLVNSLPDQSNNGIIDNGVGTPPPTEGKITMDKFRAVRKAKRF